MPNAKEYAQAIRDSKAIVKNAAGKLGVSRQAVYNAIKKYPSVKEAFDDSREDTLDFAESKLFEQIAQGNMTAIIFYLKTQAKHRGYIEKQEIANSGDMTIKVVYDE